LEVAIVVVVVYVVVVIVVQFLDMMNEFLRVLLHDRPNYLYT